MYIWDQSHYNYLLIKNTLLSNRTKNIFLTSLQRIYVVK